MVEHYVFYVFRSTPREGRRRNSAQAVFLHWFRSTPRNGGDEATQACGFYGVVSIHAPAKGATQEITDFFGRADVSIHAPAEGATVSM